MPIKRNGLASLALRAHCVRLSPLRGSAEPPTRGFSVAFESGITALVSIFTITLSLYVTNLITDATWGAGAALVPFNTPETLQRIINGIINFGAEVFFLAVLLGYAWSRTRQQFMRL